MPLLEVIACTVEDAVSAERGGAGRLEIVRKLELGGLTPPVALVREMLGAVSIPVRVMLRESAGYGVTGEPEVQALIRAAEQFADIGVEGFVLGFLRGRALDVPLMARIFRYAPALSATFHRAFEELPDPQAAVVALKGLPQFDRILTGGSAEHLRSLARMASPELEILAGGGLDRKSMRTLRTTTDIREFHVGRAARRDYAIDKPVDTAQVRALVDLLAG